MYALHLFILLQYVVAFQLKAALMFISILLYNNYILIQATFKSITYGILLKVVRNKLYTHIENSILYTHYVNYSL